MQKMCFEAIGDEDLSREPSPMFGMVSVVIAYNQPSFAGIIDHFQHILCKSLDKLEVRYEIRRHCSQTWEVCMMIRSAMCMESGSVAVITSTGTAHHSFDSILPPFCLVNLK